MLNAYASNILCGGEFVNCIKKDVVNLHPVLRLTLNCNLGRKTKPIVHDEVSTNAKLIIQMIKHIYCTFIPVLGAKVEQNENISHTSVVRAVYCWLMKYKTAS
jgi:hypothetical protein